MYFALYAVNEWFESILLHIFINPSCRSAGSLCHLVATGSNSVVLDSTETLRTASAFDKDGVRTVLG